MPINPVKKNLEFNQFARVSTSEGNRTPFFGAFQPDDGIEALADNNGRLIVRIANSGGIVPQFAKKFRIGPIAAGYISVDGIEISPLLGLITSLTLFGYSDFPTSTYLQIFDSLGSGVIPPGTFPHISYPIPAGPGAFFKDLDIFFDGVFPIFFNTLNIGISSTQFDFTPLATPALVIWGNYTTTVG